MTIERAGAVVFMLTLSLSAACGGDEDVFSPAPAGGGELGPAGSCDIVDDVLTLPTEGACALGAKQRDTYAYQGADPACRGGRVDFGGISGRQIELNGLTIRCEPPEPAPVATLGGVEPPTDAVDSGGGGGANAREETTIDGGTQGGAGVGGNGGGGLGLAAGQWLQIEDEFDGGCDLVNGGDFEAIISIDGERLFLVSRFNEDVTDVELHGLILDANFNVFSETSSEPLARIRYKYDAEGTRRPWLVRPDGRAFDLDTANGGTFPRNYRSVACQSCGLVDGTPPQSCQEALIRQIPSEGISPARTLIQRSGIIPEPNSLQVFDWSDFDSSLGPTCGLIHGTDVKLVIQTDEFRTVPERLGADVEPVGDGFSLSFFDFDDPTLGGTWHLVDASSAVRGDLVFANDSAGALSLWLLGNDGSVLTRSFQPSGSTPGSLEPAACNPCLYLAGNGQCITSDP